MPAKVAPTDDGTSSQTCVGPEKTSSKTRKSSLFAAKSTTVDFRDVWDKHNRRETDKVFFRHVQLAQDGGFSEVVALFTPDRFIWSAFQLGCVVLNLAVITGPNIRALSGDLDSDIVDADSMSRHLIVNSIIRQFTENKTVVSPTAMLAVLELSMLAFKLCHLFSVCFQYLRGDSVQRWRALANLLWEVIPDLGSFSSLRVLSKVQPKVLMPSLKRVTRLFIESPDAKRVSKLVWFLCFRLVCAVVGAEVFMIKFVIVAQNYRRAASMFMAFYIAAAFLNQLLGIVDVSKFAKKRLFVFIFGGEDSFVSPYELEVAKTWQAMLARRMWAVSKDYNFRLPWFLAVALSYGDADFQRLTLNDCESKKLGSSMSSTRPRPVSPTMPRPSSEKYEPEEKTPVSPISPAVEP